MPFTGKATFTAGSSLPEVAEDIADLVALASPYETPLLDAIGDPARVARSTVHEWLEDTLLPNTDVINDATYTDASTDTTFVVEHADRFRAGDQIQLATQSEVMLVTGVNTGTNTLTVVRGYGGTTATALADDAIVRIIGNASLEGDDAAAARFTSRARKTNYTQIFTSTVEVSGSMLAVQQAGVADELDYQKAQRTRELLRDLENSVINGRSASTDPQGSSTVRRTMRGILASLSTNVFTAGVGDFGEETMLTEDQLNLALRKIWDAGSGQIDLIVVGGVQKRAINSFGSSARKFDSGDASFKNLVNVYESDFGVCRVAMSRWVPTGHVLLLDSSRIDIVPLAGRSFHYKPLATTGDRDSGQVIGEYTLELRNENAHGVIKGLV
jgi:hypothetical protein